MTISLHRVVTLALVLCVGWVYASSQASNRKTTQQRAIDSMITSAYDAIYASDFAKAQELGDKARRLSERYGYAVGLGKVEELNGTIIQSRGEIAAALDRYYAAQEIYKRENDSVCIAGMCINLGSIAYDMREYDKAERTLIDGLRIYESIRDSAGIGACCINLGLVYHQKGNVNGHVAQILRASSIFSAIRDTLRMGIAAGNLAAAYYRNNRMKDALDQRLRALTCFTIVGRQDLANGQYSQIGETYRRLGQFDSARTYHERGLRASLAADSKENLFYAYEYLSLLDSTVGRFKQAMRHRLLGAYYREQINSINRNSEITRTEMRYEHRQKTALTQQELEHQRLVRNALIGGTAVLLVFVVVLFRQRNAVKLEKARSDALLLNILPAETAEELKSMGTSAARQYDHVTVLFTDFVNFTGIAQSLTPTELVNEVHGCFTAFDTIIERHGLEKIKTIGDAYLAVCGLPNASEDHALRTVRAAMDIAAHMKNHSRIFEVRIGINSGQVVAGVVGVKKFAFDIWGDTVNTAARLENACAPGRINISNATYQLVRDQVACEPRGSIDVDGRGPVEMYYVDQSR